MTDDLPRTLRLRRLLSDWFPLVVLGLVAVTLLAGVGTYGAYADPEYETDRQVVATLNESTAFDHSALVRNRSTVWTEGETVQNRPLYYMRLMPVLDIRYGYAYEAGDVDGGELTARTEAVLVIRARNEDGETLWRDSRPLASETSTLAPGERHELSTSVNATRVARRIARIESDLGARVGEVQVLVRVRTAVNGTVGPRSVERTHTSDLPLVVRPPTYRTATPRTVDSSVPLRTETVRQRVQPPLLTQVGGPLGFLAGLVALAGIAYASRRDMIALSEAERERCRLAEQRAQFDDWITRGDIPGIDQYQTVVRVSSLSGLVDLAIDTNNRVIEDDSAFYVLRGREDVAYVYAPSTSGIHDWLFGGFDFGGETAIPDSGLATGGAGDIGEGEAGPESVTVFERSDDAAEETDRTGDGGDGPSADGGTFERDGGESGSAGEDG